ncbi:MAG: FliI/YscN family ATPase [Victivallaceae bacterium]
MLEYDTRLVSWTCPKQCGYVLRIAGTIIEVSGFKGFIGEVCYIYGKSGMLTAIISGFNENTILLTAVRSLTALSPGDLVYPTGFRHQIRVGYELLGRVINSEGHPIDEKGPIKGKRRLVENPPPPPLKRQPISSVFETGIKVIDAFCTIGIGQKIGIFSEPGYGKSTLLTQISKSHTSDLNVIALIGERGREAQEFIEKLGEQRLKKSILVLSTSDETPASKVLAANSAMAIAEHFRDLNLNVLLIMDSISRYEQSLKELAVSSGSQKNSTLFPSVNLSLAQLLERTGNTKKGSITGIFSALSQEKTMEPNPFRVHSFLDGHIILSNPLEGLFDYPSVNITNSLSRVMSSIISSSHLKDAEYLKTLLKIYLDSRDLIQLGAYHQGVNPLLDKAIKKLPSIQMFIKQSFNDYYSFQEIVTELQNLISS